MGGIISWMNLNFCGVRGVLPFFSMVIVHFFLHLGRSTAQLRSAQNVADQPQLAAFWISHVVDSVQNRGLQCGQV